MTDLPTLIMPSGRGIEREQSLLTFADTLMQISDAVQMRISSRGWCYQLEVFRLINKNQFDRVEELINECRRKGYLPIDFTPEEGRQFSGVENPTSESPLEWMKGYLETVLSCEDFYTPDWWEGEEYYVQMVVEKIDLKTLFEPICQEYHIPIATSSGWSSMLMRAIYAARFRRAEDKGLKPVLLICGDHDPDGLRITDFTRSNLEEIKDISWEHGASGYDPQNLIIDRFGLNFDFIERNHLTWIDNLITGSGKNLADPRHKNYHMPYMQDYLRTVGVRKCEANALIARPQEGRDLCREAIERYLGHDALVRFRRKTEAIKRELDDFRDNTRLAETVREAIQMIDEEIDERHREDNENNVQEEDNE
jgi:hypothetical protein